MFDLKINYYKLNQLVMRYPEFNKVELTLPHIIKNRIARQIARFRQSFLQSQDLPFDDFFPADSIANIIAHTPHKRSSVFSPLVTLNAFISQVLEDDGSCRQAVTGVLVDRLSDGMGKQPIRSTLALTAKHGSVYR